MTVAKFFTRLFFIAVVFCLLITSTASAVEITPFAGYRMGGKFENWNTGASIKLRDSESFGVIIDFDLAPGKQLELLYSHQETSARVDPSFISPFNWDIDVDYYHIGGVNNFHNYRNFKPFVAGTIGATYFNPEKLPSESRFSLSLAGGGKIDLTDKIGLRLEARGSYSSIFCSGGGGGGGCSVQVSGSAWWQFETNVGLTMKF